MWGRLTIRRRRDGPEHKKSNVPLYAWAFMKLSSEEKALLDWKKNGSIIMTTHVWYVPWYRIIRMLLRVILRQEARDTGNASVNITS